MDWETPIAEGGGLCLVTVGLDAGATEQVRQAALHAQTGGVDAFPNYTEILLNGQLIRRLRDAEALVGLIDFDKNSELAVRATTELQAVACSQKTLIALSAEEGPESILHAMRAGCSEYLIKPLRVEPLGELLGSLKGRWLATAQRSTQLLGRVLAFMGVRGGAGATTIAVHLASFLARQQAQKTLIVDQHPCLGHVALLLGMDGHSYNFHELLQNISRLDLTLLKSYVAHHSSGTDVLPSPDLLSEVAPIDGVVLERAIRFFAGVYDFVLIDCRTGLDELNLVTAASCDELFLVATPEVPALRDLARYLDRLLELQVPPAKLKVVMNQYGSKRSVTLAQIEKAIRHPVDFTLPTDAGSLMRALDTGQPISAEQKSEFGSQVRKWAAELAPGKTRPAEAKHRFVFWG